MRAMASGVLRWQIGWVAAAALFLGASATRAADPSPSFAADMEGATPCAWSESLPASLPAYCPRITSVTPDGPRFFWAPA